VVDNGSVYTKNLIEFLSTIKTKFTSISNFDLDFAIIPKYDSFILSGRRKNSKDMNALNSRIIKHAVSENKPLLGICYGAEILALTLGGTIKKTNQLYKGEQEVSILKVNPLCSGKIRVFESHNYEISRLNDKLHGLAKSEDCLYEIIQYDDSKIFGTQFHPEMSHDGKSIIKAFVSQF
jgi:GMP synthase (glutamine-hydrolysing)